MPKYQADESDVVTVQEQLSSRNGLAHLRVRKYGAQLILESGPKDDTFRHARLRRISVQDWTLEMPTHTGKWESTPYRHSLTEILGLLVESFGWTLQPVHENPERTSDLLY